MAAKTKSPAKKKSAAPRKGILGGGNFIIDQVKMIDVWPQRHTLANISDQSEGTGGAPHNVLLDLAKMGAKFPLAAAGAVGKDALGDQIAADLKANKVDTKHLKPIKGVSTSYTDVMTEEEGGARTFFHMRGANAQWTGSDIDFKKIRHKIFHLGYILLLDALDQKDEKHGTKAAALLKKAQAAGMKTSVDCVSEDSDRFNDIVSPALEYTDYCVINEFEAGKITGYKLRDEDDKLDTVFVRHAAGAILQKGVGEVVVIHFPEGGFVARAMARTTGRPPSRFPRNTSKVRPVQGMLFARVCFTVCTKAKISRTVSSSESVPQPRHWLTPPAPVA